MDEGQIRILGTKIMDNSSKYLISKLFSRDLERSAMSSIPLQLTDKTFGDQKDATETKTNLLKQGSSSASIRQEYIFKDKGTRFPLE